MNPKEQIIKIAKDAISKNLPNVKPDMLEEDGKIYYMNDKDDTIFSWSYNNHSCPFMSFYNDGMGALKITPYSDGKVDVVTYDETKAHEKVAVDNFEMKPEDVLALACFMHYNADEKKRFGSSLDDLVYETPEDEKIAEFQKLCRP